MCSPNTRTKADLSLKRSAVSAVPSQLVSTVVLCFSSPLTGETLPNSVKHVNPERATSAPLASCAPPLLSHHLSDVTATLSSQVKGDYYYVSGVFFLTRTNQEIFWSTEDAFTSLRVAVQSQGFDLPEYLCGMHPLNPALSRAVCSSPSAPAWSCLRVRCLKSFRVTPGMGPLIGVEG